MARQFGGKFSPGAAAKAAIDKPPRPKSGFRAWLLTIAPLPLVFSGFGNVTAANPAGFLRDFGAFSILVLAAWLLREGLKAEAAYDARKSAHKPAFPRKAFASALTGLGVALALTGGSGGAIIPPALGILAAVLHVLAFGLDPMKNKGETSLAAVSDRRAARAVDAAETYVTAMLDALNKVQDRDLQRRMDDFVASARDVFRAVQSDPRDLAAARKYLTVYLMGARDATIKFAALYQKDRDASARAAYVGLLGDLETNFKSQRQELLLDDRSDLDIEIDVLRDRLRREGVQSQ